MNCLKDCQPCKCLSSPCFDEEEAILVIGSVSEEGNISVYVQNMSSGRTEVFNATPDAYGTIFIDMAARPGFFHPMADYVVWATIAEDDIMNNLNITIDLIDYICLRFSFERVFNIAGESEVSIQHLDPIL